MPADRTVTRRLAAACLAIVAVLAIAGPAAALAPPQPLPGYRPAFVTETDQHPWRDCLWASAAMLLDKWTNGDVVRTHQQLRTLSGDTKGGSTLKDLHVAFAKLGFSTPDSLQGDRLTWSQLLSRLQRGAGAVVLGDYGKLPRHFGRWDYGFWKGLPVDGKPAAPKPAPKPAATAAGKATAKPKPRPDNHAVYIERYDPRHGRVWLMDPLASGAWKGEWISVRSLKRFAWSSGGHVYAVTTPVAAPAPFTGVRIGGASVNLSPGAVTATWQLHAPRSWRFPGGDVHVSILPAASPLEAAARSALVNPGTSTRSAPARPTVLGTGQALTMAAALPKTPGAYVAGMSLTDRRFGRRVVSSAPVAVFVPGDQRATMRLNVLDAFLSAGGAVHVNLTVANAGDQSWADPTGADGDPTIAPLRTARDRETRVTAHWIRLDAPSGRAGPASEPADAAPVTLMDVPLDPGQMARYRGALTVPSELGTWALVVDVEDSIVGSFAAQGNAPAVAVFQVVPARGIDPVD
jgi:hypothetical protein